MADDERDDLPVTDAAERFDGYLTALLGDGRPSPEAAAFTAAVAAYGLSSLAMFGIYIYITQYLQLVLGLSPFQAGLATLPWSISFVIGSLLAPRLAQHWSGRTILSACLMIAALGFALLAVIGETSGLPVLLAGTVITSIGFAPIFTIGNEMIITSAPPERAGAASALSETSSEFSGALGVAVFGSIGTALYRHELARGLPVDIPADAALAAMETLGGAVAIAGHLSGPGADAVLIAARSAFVDTMRIIAFVSAAIMVAAAFLSARMLAPKP